MSAAASQTTLFGSSLDERFEKFHADNPHVYRELVALARQFRRIRNSSQLAIATLFEVLRWQSLITTTSEDGYKLNNSYRSRYARRIMACEPDLAGIFETRDLND